MTRLEQLQPGTIVKGVLPSEPVRIVERNWRASNSAVGIIYEDATGNLGKELLYRDRESTLEIVTAGPSWAFDGDGEMFRLVSEAYRIQLAHLFDPLLAVHTSRVQPLPHQITAVYKDMLPRQPLRYLLADDPGAGKTIMTGLYLKELLVRGDLERCLIVCPGSLVEQWQTELSQRFGLSFEIFTREKFDTARTGNLFQEEDLLICRLDQLSRDRNKKYQTKLKATSWDIIVCDEAHKMSVSVSGNKQSFTGRYRLGQLLGKLTRHFLLLTATPHNGKEAEFQGFMALLDPDRFEGHLREGVQAVNTTDLMRRMVKENLLKFDGTQLFPERYAYTINYELSELEKQLYDAVTEYVRKEMNRALDEIKGQRGNRIGFALTILQRRLASSPEAIYSSIQRRRERLEAQEMEWERNVNLENQEGLTEIPTNTEEANEYYDEFYDETPDEFYDETPAEEVETTEEEVVAHASAAGTISELQAEIQTLQRLEALAQRVRESNMDRKWEELSNLLQGESDAAAAKELFDPQGQHRKLIIFTEHRDTLRYLTERIRTLIAPPEAVVTIHGGVRPEERKKVQEAFMDDSSEVRILIATDAAGEGINLHSAHLMVNYDLPWNPNRIEQRFGRIHRIGQTEVCNLWNLVASETREGEVFSTLLYKLEQQREALGGAVFDVLGKCFNDTSLRDLLIRAVREGNTPEARAWRTKVIDGVLDIERLRELIDENVLARETIDVSRLGDIREDMERAEAQRLQPYFIASFFREAFVKLGGKLQEHEPGRYEVRYVPPVIRNYSSGVGHGISHQYDRITFEKEELDTEKKPPAEFVCPGHPLLDATLDAILEQNCNLLKHGTVLIDSSEQNVEVRVLFYLEHTIKDGTQQVVSQQMQFVEINSEKAVSMPGYAPYLDYRSVNERDKDEISRVENLLELPWLHEDLESDIIDYAVEHLVPGHVNEVKVRKDNLVPKTMAAVKERLEREIDHLNNQAKVLEREAEAVKGVVECFKELVEENPELGKHETVQEILRDASSTNQKIAGARQSAEDLENRLIKRMEKLKQELHISSMEPVVIGGALIVPQSLLEASDFDTSVPSPVSQTNRERIDRLAVDAVIEAERSLGREPMEMPHHNPGFDIESRDPSTNQLLFIEVKGKAAGATSVTVSKTQISTALNKPDGFVLAIVEVESDTAKEPRYIRELFKNEPDFGVASITYKLDKILERATPPS